MSVSIIKTPSETACNGRTQSQGWGSLKLLAFQQPTVKYYSEGLHFISLRIGEVTSPPEPGFRRLFEMKRLEVASLFRA